MENNYLLQSKPQDIKNKWIYNLGLFLSFIWVSVYPACCGEFLGSNFINYGKLFSEDIFFAEIIITILVTALASWISFEIIFYLYRLFLSFKIYSFIVPQNRIKYESKLFFIYRNIFLGLFINISFIYPYLFNLNMIFDIAITLIALMCYAVHLNKTYAEPIVGHFVFKTFCVPVFFYEAINLIEFILEVL